MVRTLLASILFLFIAACGKVTAPAAAAAAAPADLPAEATSTSEQ